MAKIPVLNVFKNGKFIEKVYIHGNVIVLGRHHECDVIFRNPNISRFHLRIHLKPYSHQLFVEDLFSTQGSWLSEKKIEPDVQIEMKEGDVLRMGGSGITYKLHWISDIVEYNTQLNGKTKREIEDNIKNEEQGKAGDNVDNLLVLPVAVKNKTVHEEESMKEKQSDNLMTAPENGKRERKIKKGKEMFLAAALRTIPDALIQATLFATFDLGHSFLDLNKMGHKFFVLIKPKTRLRNTLELVKPKTFFSHLFSLPILQPVYPHINESQIISGFNVGDMGQLNSFSPNSELFPFDPSTPIPLKPNFTFNYYDPFLVDPIMKNEKFSIYFPDFNFKRRVQRHPSPWILLFAFYSWPIALLPLWIWEEVRRAFSIGVFFSSARPNSRSSSFFLVW